MENRPQGRQKHVTGESKGVYRRGAGLGTGPVGGGRPSGGGPNRSSGGGRGSILKAIIVIAILLFGGKFGFDFAGDELLGGSSSDSTYTTPQTGWTTTANTGKLDTSVADGARQKRVSVAKDGSDTVTVMVYMCGTDLESGNGMATSDLKEMQAAKLGKKVNVIVFTGGCKKWKNSVVSNKSNQIYQVKNGGLACVKKDAGKGAMTDPNTLSDFIKWCHKNYPANRNELIFWDHGGGSVSGYGYDEKNPNAGSMGLSKIDQALKKAGVTFEWIGFDACLMATLETGLMLNQYADYMIASEETEPGIGWYYTNWLTKLASDTSQPAIETGKYIADDFVSECAKACRGQKTTLSVTDLAELSATAPAALKNFSSSISGLLEEDKYQQVSDARYGSREFAQSSKIDQVDLIHLAKNMKTKEGKQLSDILLSAVKYNKTSSNMTNAYGLSIYFPYRKMSSVDRAVSTYREIGMGDEYSKCIKQFASVEASGQSHSTNAGMGNLLESLMQSNGTGNVNIGGYELDLSSLDFLKDALLDQSKTDKYVSNHTFDASALKWKSEHGKNVIKLSEDQWSLVHDLALSVFFDDGSGYIDLGLDDTFEFDEDGNLIGDTDGTWLAINSQPVTYYYENKVTDGDNYTITGYVPAELNGKRVSLLITFDQDHPYGFIAGARAYYKDGQTDTVAKAITLIKPGDKLDFICDYYSYDGTYQDSYHLGETMTVTDNMQISNVPVTDGDLSVRYRFSDIYNNQFWTEEIQQKK